MARPKQKTGRNRPKPPNKGRASTLTPRELQVIDRYFTNGFGKTEALSYVGYRWAETNTYDFFHRPLVMAEIERRQARLRAKQEITEDRVIQELAAIGFARLSNILSVDEDGKVTVDLLGMSETERAALSEFSSEPTLTGQKIKVKFHDKKSALVELGKGLGYLKERLEVEAGEDLAALLLAGRRRAAKAEPA